MCILIVTAKHVHITIFMIASFIYIGSGSLLVVVVKSGNESPRRPLFFKILLVAFLFAFVFGPSVLVLEIYAKHLAYRVGEGVILAAYLGALSCYVGRW